MSKNNDVIQVSISYAHTNEDHKERVDFIARELMEEHGLEVKLDLWTFRKGQDLNKGMEQLTTNSDVVLIIGDENYVEKANERSGGVGRESVILSENYFKKIKSETSKILYAYTDKDESGSPIIPNYMLGINSFDLTNEEKDFEKIEEIAREIYDLPVIEAPKRGVKPDYTKKNRMLSIRKVKSKAIIDKKLLNELIIDIKSELSELDSEFANYLDINVKRDFSRLKNLLTVWDEINQKVNKSNDIGYILQELIKTIKLDTNETDATSIFIRVAFVYSIAFGITSENFKLIDDLIKYDYSYDGRVFSYSEINLFTIVGFLEAESYATRKSYRGGYFEIEEQIIRDTELSIIDIIEADVFLEFVNLFYKAKDDEAKSNMDWAILDKDYPVIRKYIAEFKFLNSFKRVTTVNNLFTILNVNDLTEFKKIIESINKAKVFQIIEKDKIASQK
ncbi:toll/interleukin-1 receptor domain-containing protein [Staphylococcus equorum]|uniref:toll/interleukin-1 receptor domain-containing protein n=1 Tax=Staphylococcus equorum TaxID=246432 RepID=UPI002DBC56FC|nr:toll/interleukin-1 receptor domain-containing protein [Staphylococcus equorum]MEB7794719.1 toll/interleukin-1 receptor domain-containing protein [Staphylococcus equorum]